jgi:hypothetical protein
MVGTQALGTVKQIPIYSNYTIMLKNTCIQFHVRTLSYGLLCKFPISAKSTPVIIANILPFLVFALVLFAPRFPKSAKITPVVTATNLYIIFPRIICSKISINLSSSSLAFVLLPG